jgi:hypothetical protein
MGGYQGLLNTFDHFMSTLPISRLKQGTIASLVVEYRVLHTPHGVSYPWNGSERGDGVWRGLQ